MIKEERIAKAKAALEVANLRIKAVSQRDYAAAYMRQASHPAYDGQEIVCINKAEMCNALAAKTDAQADLLDAENS